MSARRSLLASLATASVAWTAWLLWAPAHSEAEHSERPLIVTSPQSAPARLTPQISDTSLHTATAAHAAPNILELNEALRTLEEFSATDKQKALKYAQETAELFPETGVQAEARSAKEITLLVELDRMSEARALVRKFIKTHPDSRYRPLVQGVTGIHPRPTGPRQP